MFWSPSSGRFILVYLDSGLLYTELNVSLNVNYTSLE